MGGGTAFNTPGAAGFQRPLVVVMHRGMDLVSALRHNRYATTVGLENSELLSSDWSLPLGRANVSKDDCFSVPRPVESRAFSMVVS